MKMCSICYQDESEFVGSVCKKCRHIMDYNLKHPKNNHKGKEIIYHATNLLGYTTKSLGGWGRFYTKDDERIILVDVKAVMRVYPLDYIPYIVNILSHEIMHQAIRDVDGQFACFMMDRSKTIKKLKPYFGGTPTPTPDITIADRWYSKHLAEWLKKRAKSNK